MKRNKKGFTLVELIVVVAIMAVLAGTVAGVVVSTQNKTKNSQADSSAKNLAEQMIIHLNADLTRPEQEYINIETDPYTWQPKSGSIEVGSKRFLDEIVATYDDGALITDSGASAPKAGTNKYLVLLDGLSFKIQFKEVGTGAKTVTYTVAIPDGGDMFTATRTEA